MQCGHYAAALGGGLPGQYNSLPGCFLPVFWGGLGLPEGPGLIGLLWSLVALRPPSMLPLLWLWS